MAAPAFIGRVEIPITLLLHQTPVDGWFRLLPQYSFPGVSTAKTARIRLRLHYYFASPHGPQMGQLSQQSFPSTITRSIGNPTSLPGTVINSSRPSTVSKEKFPCPICGKKFLESEINQHADKCVDVNTKVNDDDDDGYQLSSSHDRDTGISPTVNYPSISNYSENSKPTIQPMEQAPPSALGYPPSYVPTQISGRDSLPVVYPYIPQQIQSSFQSSLSQTSSPTGVVPTYVPVQPPSYTFATSTNSQSQPTLSQSTPIGFRSYPPQQYMIAPGTNFGASPELMQMYSLPMAVGGELPPQYSVATQQGVNYNGINNNNSTVPNSLDSLLDN